MAQDGTHSCSKCQASFTGEPGPCPAGGTHDVAAEVPRAVSTKVLAGKQGETHGVVMGEQPVAPGTQGETFGIIMGERPKLKAVVKKA